MPRIRLQSGELRDEIMQPQYDTYDLLAGVDPSGIGTIVFYGNVQNKPQSQTNLRINQSLEAATSFRCTGLGLMAQNIVAGNSGVLPTLMQTSFLQFNVGEKIYWTGNTSLAAGRLYQNAAVAVPAAGPGAEVLIQSYGSPAARSVIFSRLHTVDILPLQTFNVKWTIEDLTAADIAAATPVAGSYVRFIMVLFGLLRRAAQ